jgi:outer membrane receptor protein involved in Fe transport
LLASPLLAGDSDPGIAAFGETITVEEAARPARPGVVERKAGGDLERSPDTNAAEAAARLPGVIVEGELGEADRVLVRGAEARLVATTLDGERLPSPDGEARSAGLSLIPPQLLEEVAVAKTLTADRDADAVGGTVDLVTRRAPAAGLRMLELTGGAEVPSGGALYGGNLAFGRRLLEGRLGVLTAVTAESAEREVDGVLARYGDEGLEQSETLGYALLRERLGALATVDLIASENAGIELRSLYSRIRTEELRRRVKDDLDEGLIERELKDAELWRDLLSVAVSGHRLFGSTLLEASLGGNGAAEREPDRVDTSFVQEGVEFDTEDGDGRPAASNQDPDLFVLDKIGVEDNDTRERNLFATVDLTRPLGAEAPWAVLKAGAKLRDKSKRRDVEMTLFRPEGEIYLRDWTGPLSGGSRREPMIDPESARRLLASLGLSGQPGQEEETADYRAAETAAAAYAQAEVKLGRLTLLPGVRYEHTWSDYRGFELTSGAAGSTLRPLRGESSYGLWLPMLHAGIALRPELELHAALTRGFARPDYFDLVPYRLLDAEDQEIEEGNAGLRPTRSWNFDGRLDWRPALGRSISAGIFYRTLTDFTFIRRSRVMREGDLWDSTRPENGEKARLYGGELLMRWRLPQAAGPLAGWDIEASSTWTRSEAWAAGDGRSPLRLPGQSPWTGSLALSYDRGRLAGTLAVLWAAPYLAELGTARDEDLFRDDQRRLDLALSYTFASGLRWQLEARNLTADPLRKYMGGSGRPVLQESSGRSLRSGFSIHF